MTQDDERQAGQLRKRIFLTAWAGGIGHLASAFSLVEILQTLYLKGVLRVSADAPEDESRDRLILSKGHGSLALYNVLCEAGFLTQEQLFSFAQPGSFLGGEPHGLEVPGVDASTGSLGHGLSIGVGMALAAKARKLPFETYVILGDGECEEGSVWEAVMAAAAYKLDNLTVILDHNRVQKMDFVEEILSITDWKRRWEAFGWQTRTVDGHDVDALLKCFQTPWQAGAPKLVIAQTVKGKGLSIMENNPAWHWRMPSKKELKVFMRELSIAQEELDECKRRT